jgi:peroxiredoxin
MLKRGTPPGGETPQWGLITCSPGGTISDGAARAKPPDKFTKPLERKKARRIKMRADIVPGGTFPDYELTDHTKIRRRLSDLQCDDPMILVLSRGHFCPKDHQQHLKLVEFYPEIVVGYTQIVTIATDNIFTVNDFRASVGAQWTFLSDAGRKVQKDLDIQEYTDPHDNPTK